MKTPEEIQAELDAVIEKIKSAGVDDVDALIAKKNFFEAAHVEATKKITE